METTTHIIPERNLPTLLDRVEKLNKRCRKLSIPLIKITHELDHYSYKFISATPGSNAVWVHEDNLDEFTRKNPHMAKTGLVMKWYRVDVTGEAPKYQGWEFIATLEPLQTDSGPVNLVMTMPGKSCPTSFMAPEAVGKCDHCHAVRNRKQTFVVLHESGVYKAVGRQCIKDFLGHADPNKLATWAEILISLEGFASSAEDEGWLGGGGREVECYDLEFFLGWTAGVIRNHGWMGRVKAREQDKIATVDRVFGFLNPFPFSDEHERRKFEEDLRNCRPTEEDLKEAIEALNWAENLDLEELMKTGGNEYLANVAAIARAGFVDRRTAGLGGSIIAGFANSKEQAKKAAEKAARPESRNVGKAGVRQTVRVIVEKIIKHEGAFGITYITRMVAWDDERQCFANHLVWFASSAHDLDEGEEYKVKLTPKSYEIYNGIRQTTVQRVAITK